jgi:alpha-L-fucosidase
MVVRALLEFAARDGNFAVSVPITPTGGLEPGAPEMLADLGEWMAIHGRGIYGSKAWKRFGEGDKVMPRGALNRRAAQFEFDAEDLRFTVGKDGALYVWCMTVPAGGSKLHVRSLGKSAGLLERAPKNVEMLGSSQRVEWTSHDDALTLTCPDTTGARHAVGFRITF